jgi:hypothetical protein
MNVDNKMENYAVFQSLKSFIQQIKELIYVTQIPHNPKNKLEEIYESKIVHNSFIDKESVVNAMTDSYNLGVNDVLNWLSKMDYLSDNIEYIIEEWYNLNPKTKS